MVAMTDDGGGDVVDAQVVTSQHNFSQWWQSHQIHGVGDGDVIVVVDETGSVKHQQKLLVLSERKFFLFRL